MDGGGGGGGGTGEGAERRGIIGLSHRRNWAPHPLPHKRVCLHPWARQGGGEQHFLAVQGVRRPNSDDRKPGTRYTLWGREEEVM